MSVSLQTDQIVALCITGEWDITNVDALRDQIEHEFETGNDLVLDLSEATFIDSSIIHALFGAVRRANGSDQTVVLQLGTAPIVERVLEICGIERHLRRAYDRDEAVELARASRPASAKSGHST